MAITPDDILRPGGLEPAGATSPANLARLLDRLGASVDPDRAAAVQATINRVTAKAQLSKATAKMYLQSLERLARSVADSDLLGPAAWDGRTLPIPLEVIAVDLAERRTDQKVTRRTAELTVKSVVWVNQHGRFPDQPPSEAQDTTGWPTVDSVPVIAELLAGWDVDLPRWQCQALVVDQDASGISRRLWQTCRADTPTGRCRATTAREGGRCREHQASPVAHPFEDITRRRRCFNATVRPGQLCFKHATWQVCRARSTAGDRCGWTTINQPGLCRQHQDGEVEFDPAPGPVDTTPIQVDPTRKATPIRAHHIEALAWTDPAHRHRAELVHAGGLLLDAGVSVWVLADLDQTDFRFDGYGQVSFEVPHPGQKRTEPSVCVAALCAYHDDTGQRPKPYGYEAWAKTRCWPGRQTIVKRLGAWSEALAMAFDGVEPPPDNQPLTFTLVGGHADQRDDPVAALRAVLANPDCADKPFSFLTGSQLDGAIRRAKETGDFRYWWRIDTRDSALILVGWWWGIRRSELVSLRLDQFEADPDLEVLWLRYNPETSKTNRDDRVARRCTCDTEIVQPVKTEVVEGTDHDGWFRRTETVERRQRVQRPGLCPIRALCEWLACDEWLPPPTACGDTALEWLQTFLNSLDATDRARPAFHTIGQNHASDPTTPAYPTMVAEILRGRLDRCADLDWAQSHGFRRGQATEMRAASVDWDDIMDDLGWKTRETAYGYVQLLDDPDRVRPGMTALRAVLVDDDGA